MIKYGDQQCHRCRQSKSTSGFAYWRNFALAFAVTSSLLVTFILQYGLCKTRTSESSILTNNRILKDDPYHHSGTLATRNGTNSVIHFWDPFDSSLPRPPHLIQAVKERHPLPWLQNKTILIIGDSVDRFATQFFCELVNSEFYHANMTNLDVQNERDYLSPKTNPVICRVDHYNFEIVSFSHFGLQNDSDEFWSFKYGYTAPGLMENRIPLLTPLFNKHNRQPDMIIMGSGLWDILKWAIEDKYAFRPVEEMSVQPYHLHQWLERAEKFVDLVQSMFPNAFTMWRFLHYCKVDWFGLEMQDPPDASNRAPFHESRIYQLNNIYTRLLERRPHLYKFSWGELLTGHLADAMFDSSHPNRDFGAALWGDMILYYLSRIKS